jgi:hypothetical protein
LQLPEEGGVAEVTKDCPPETTEAGDTIK